MTLNPFDVQSRHIVTTDGVAEPLYAGFGMRGGQQYVMVKDNMKHSYGFDQGATRDVGVLFLDEISKTLSNGTRPGHHNSVVIEGENMKEKYVVRRLMPKECARLQGFPSDYCSDVPHSDSAEYKLWGNGIALPCLIDMMLKIAQIERGER